MALRVEPEKTVQDKHLRLCILSLALIIGHFNIDF